MNPSKRERLEAAGWKVGSVAEFLGLDDVEAAVVEIRLELGRSLRELRRKKGLTQVELAQRLKSSQSRVAKMESADASVSLDLVIRSLLARRARPGEIAGAIERAGAPSRSGDVRAAADRRTRNQADWQ